MIAILSTVLQVGFEIAQHTFSEDAGQVTIHVVRENTVTISQSFTVEVAVLPTSTAREGVLVHSKNYICWIDNDVCYVRFVMLSFIHHKYLFVLSELCSGVL